MAQPLKPTAEYAVETGDTLDHDDWLASKRAGETTNGATDERSRFSAVAHLDLSRLRFAFTIVVSVSALVALLLVFVHGVVIDKNVLDELGSTKEVNEKVEKYQVINGYVTAAVGLIMESYFEVFTVVTVTFLANVRWYPGDKPKTGGNRFKRFCLWAFPPWIMFVLNVAIAATFISHKTTGVRRVFLKDDLVMNKAFSVATLNASTAGNLTSLGNQRSVLDTILRGAVRRQVAPFEMLTDSPCVLANATAGDKKTTTDDLPSVKEVRSSAVVFGFPLQDWNLDAMPFGLVPKHTIEFKLSEVNASDTALTKKFDVFQKATQLSWTTAYEMLLQGKVLFERSVSDSDVSNEYPCIRVTDPALFAKLDPDAEESANATTKPNTPANAPSATTKTPATTTPSATTKKPATRSRYLQTTGSIDDGFDYESSGSDDEDFDPFQYDTYDDGPFKGEDKCRGAVSSLHLLANASNPSMHSINVFLHTMIDGFIATVPQVEPESMDLTMSTYDVSPQMKLTTMTLDMPYFESTPYRNTTDYCNGDVLTPAALKDLQDENGNMTKEEIAEITGFVCDQTSYPYLTPREACGHNNCIFLDKSGTIPFKKQLQLMPYLTNCSAAEVRYSADFLNFFPTGCVARDDAVFLYGLGSYMAGDLFTVGDAESFPYIDNPRRHVVVSFAKLEWKTDELHTKFNADCKANTTCKGLLYNLENVTEPALNMSGKTEKRVRMLVLGQDHFPTDLKDKDFKNPVQLVSLNTRPFYYAKDHAYYEWEYIDKKRFNQSTWPDANDAKGGLTAEQCSPLIDSYIAQVEKNRFYIDEPLQPLYTSALYYLFQDAAIKTVKVTKNVTTGVEALELSVVGTTMLKGDKEKHKIKFSIPLASLISTFAGMFFLFLLVVLVLVCPTERLKMSEETNIAVRYAELVQNDEYPEEVFERTLQLPSGETVQMDEYVVESTVVHFTRDEEKKVYL